MSKFIDLTGLSRFLDKCKEIFASKDSELWEKGRAANGSIQVKGSDCNASGDKSVAEGYYTTASGDQSHAEGDNTIASGNGSHAEGFYTASMGAYSHVEGNGAIANGYCSHAEGTGSVAGGNQSHAEGNYTTAIGDRSHSEGNGTKAYGSYSHSEGSGTTANGNYSHAEGDSTVTRNKSEHAEGQFNVSHKATTEYGSSGNTQHSVGIGMFDDDARNAFEIMQNGDVYIKGIGGYDGTNPNTSGVKTIQQMMLSPLNIKLLNSVEPIDYVNLAEEVIDNVYLIDIDDEPPGMLSPSGCVYDSHTDCFFPRLDDVNAKEINTMSQLSDDIQSRLLGTSFEVTDVTGMVIFCNYYKHDASFNEILNYWCVAALYFYSENANREMIAFCQYEY